MKTIKRLAIFPTIIKNEWMFRVSISDEKNILIYAFNIVEPIFMMRYFDDKDIATAWVDEVVNGKHVE